MFRFIKRWVCSLPMTLDNTWQLDTVFISLFHNYHVVNFPFIPEITLKFFCFEYRVLWLSATRTIRFSLWLTYRRGAEFDLACRDDPTQLGKQPHPASFCWVSSSLNLVHQHINIGAYTGFNLREGVGGVMQKLHTL